MNIYWITTTVLTVGFGEVMAGDPTYDTGIVFIVIFIIIHIYIFIYIYTYIYIYIYT